MFTCVKDFFYNEVGTPNGEIKWDKDIQLNSQSQMFEELWILLLLLLFLFFIFYSKKLRKN